MNNLIEIEYQEVKVGQEFKIIKYDHRVYRKESNGALQIVNSYGLPSENENYKVYCYRTMPVWVEQKCKEKTHETN